MRNWVNLICTFIAASACLLSLTFTAFVIFWPTRTNEQATLFNVPIRTTLVADSMLEWSDRDRVKKIGGEFEELGFELVGDFQLKGVAGLLMRAYTKPQTAMFAEITEHPDRQLVISVATAYQDGSVVECTTPVEVAIKPPQNFTVHQVDGNVRDLCDKLSMVRPPENIQTVQTNQFATFREKIYAREIDALLARGGPSPEEIRSIATAAGHDLTPKQIAELQTIWKGQAAKKVDDYVWQSYLTKNGLSEKSHSRDSFLVVHDLVDPQILLMQLLSMTTKQNIELPEGLESAIQFDRAANTREAFAHFAAQTHSGWEFQKVESGDEPIPHDIYRLHVHSR
jgi:hypothetical protein